MPTGKPSVPCPFPPPCHQGLLTAPRSLSVNLPGRPPGPSMWGVHGTYCALCLHFRVEPQLTSWGRLQLPRTGVGGSRDVHGFLPPWFSSCCSLFLESCPPSLWESYPPLSLQRVHPEGALLTLSVRNKPRLSLNFVAASPVCAAPPRLWWLRPTFRGDHLPWQLTRSSWKGSSLTHRCAVLSVFGTGYPSTGILSN